MKTNWCFTPPLLFFLKRKRKKKKNYIPFELFETSSMGLIEIKKIKKKYKFIFPSVCQCVCPPIVCLSVRLSVCPSTLQWWVSSMQVMLLQLCKALYDFFVCLFVDCVCLTCLWVCVCLHLLNNMHCQDCKHFKWHIANMYDMLFCSFLEKNKNAINTLNIKNFQLLTIWLFFTIWS